MIVLIYKIELLEPVLITGLKGDPNSAVGLDYIPGSVIRGALIARYARTNGKVDASDRDQRKLFFDGSTRYLNAYPVDSNGERTLPVPMSWMTLKYTGEGGPKEVYDFVLERRRDKEYKSLRQPFCSIRGDHVELVDPERWLAVHTYRARRFGRPVERQLVATGEDPGTLFRYDSLAEGQIFSGVVLCPDTDAAGAIEPLLDGEFWFGGARTAGYGRVSIFDVQKIEDPSWREVGGSIGKNNERVVVTLLSDAIVRDENGQLRPSAKAVEQAIQSVAGGNWKVRTKESYFRPCTVGGFNRKWGLPLPQAWAAAKGNVFVFNVGDDPDFAKLEREGIGERRVDGFGRVAVNWQQWSTLDVLSLIHI